MNPLKITPSWDENDMISPRAADFIERQRSLEWNDADQAALDTWLAESTFHRVAYLRLDAAIAYTGHLAEIRTFKIGPVSPETKSGRGRWLNRSQFIIPVLAAASIVLAASFGGRLVAYLVQPPDSLESTDTGGRTLLTYGDHTQIELNTNTTVRIRMTTAERTVWLEKGEAWFHVAHNATHPFTVFVAGHRVTDLGTDFLVRRDANDVDISLLQGSVTLSGSGPQTATLRPGDEAIATSASVSVTRRTPQELKDELAWRHGMLVFRNTPLSEVVREFNRYNTTKLIIADPAIAALRFNGEIRNDRVEDFLFIAQDMMKLRADRQGMTILLSRDTTEKKKRATHPKRGA